MELKNSAHADTFPRDHLPPTDQWPDLVLGPPGPHYPERLNCGAELLDATIERFGPDRPVFRTGQGEVWTYRELRDRVDRIAHVLTGELGVVPGNRVLLRGPTTPWLAACWLAVMKAGAVAVTVLAQQRAHELGVMCSIARISHALCDARALADLERADAPGLRITAYGGDEPGDLLNLVKRAPAGRFSAVDTSADDVALIAFTSGTTGRPKGCMHFHRDVLAIADTFARHVLKPTPDDVFAGSPRSASPSGSAAWSSSRCGRRLGPAARTGGPPAAVAGPRRAPRIGPVHRADRVPDDAGGTRRARPGRPAPLRLGR